MEFIEKIYEQARSDQKKIAVPESTNEVMLKASAKVHADGICQIVLVGDPEKIQAKAAEIGADITGIQITKADHFS